MLESQLINLEDVRVCKAQILSYSLNRYTHERLHEGRVTVRNL